LKSLGVQKELPVFITETGWMNSADPQNYKIAYEEVWQPDDRVMAVTPFVLNYIGEPFAQFSWRKGDGSFYPNYDVVYAMEKVRGDPEIIDAGFLLMEKPAVLVASSKYDVYVTLDNRGQAIWAAEEAEKARYEERRLAREELLKRVFSRPEVRGFTASGKPRRGIPVLQREWPSLPEGTFVVVVESYNDETNKAGALVEAFRVERKPGRNPEKGSCVAVSGASGSTNSSTTSNFMPTKTVVVELPDGMFEIPVYNSAEEIRQARISGLNGGSFAGIERGEKVEVYAVSHDKVATVGHFSPL
jgi:hypothetical protein